MTDKNENSNVVDFVTFRQGSNIRSDDKFDEALRKQKQQDKLNKSAEEIATSDHSLLCSQTETVRDDILKYMRTKMVENSLMPDHPNYWVIHQALEEMLEVGFRMRNTVIAEDLLMIDDFPGDIFDTTNIPVKDWTDLDDD